MWRVVIRPWWLRPPLRFCFSSSGWYGSPLCRVSVLTRTMARRPGEVGLNVISAMGDPASGLGHHVDRLAFGQANVCLAPVAATAFARTEGLDLALDVQHVDCLDFDVEQLLHRRLHVGLGG